jgi:hypothetical protein
MDCAAGPAGAPTSTAMLTCRTALAGGAAGTGERLVHDLADGARATPALGAAAETPIDLAGRARRLLGTERRAHVLVGQYVAGADDHGDGRAFQPA